VKGGKGSAKVDYQPLARVLTREDALASLRAVSSDGRTLLFDASNRTLAALKAGDVLVLRGLCARKVLEVLVDGPVVAVLTESAALTDVVNEGRIRIDAPIRFTEQAAPGFAGIVDNIIPAAHAAAPGNSVSASKKDWNATYTVTPSKGRLDVALTLTRDIYGFKAIVTGQGYLTDFDLQSDIEIQQGSLTQLQATFKRINGVMNITWEVGKETPGKYEDVVQIKLPAAITVPLYSLLDGFPLFLEVTSAVIAQPFIQGGMQYSHGKFRITYDGAQGFRAKEGTIDPEGNISGDIKFLEDRHISAVAPVGMVVGIAAPRIELTLDPLKMLSELQEKGGLQKVMQNAAAKADEYAGKLKEKLAGTTAGKALEAASKAMGDPTAGQMVDSMKSTAAAYINFSAVSAMTNSGLSAIAPCTHTDLTVTISVGASAQAFGQKLPRVSKDIFQKKITRIDPPTAKLCQY
jgi:hypothetical protein